MKKKIFQSVKLVLFFTIMLAGSQLLMAQDIKTALSLSIPSQNNIIFFTPDQLTKKWTEFSADKQFQVIQKDVASKKFARILNKEASWGFTGTMINDKGEKVAVTFCTFDFLNPANIKQGCSMVWSNVGTKSYKAYLIFPEGETKDINRKFAESQEWYVDSTNSIQKASSWGRNFLKCVQRGVSVPNIETELSNERSRIKIGGGTVTVTCPGICLAGALACSTLAATVAVTITLAGVVAAGTEGVGLPILIAAGGIGGALLLNCVGASCGACTILCALGAMQ